jgi:hypothetical protein
MSQSIKDRIRKLLNLANNKGATEAEATNAMEMASALMLRYNIELEPDSDELKVIRGSTILEGYDEKWHLTCSSAAACLCYVQNVKYVDGHGGFYFVGRKDSVEAAEQLMVYIIDQVERLYKEHLPKGLPQPIRAEFRRTFKYACANRVMQRAWDIVEQFRNNDAVALEYTGSTALVVVESIDIQLKEARDFLSKQSGVKDLVTRPPKGGNGTLVGLKAGDRVELNKGVGQNEKRATNTRLIA